MFAMDWLETKDVDAKCEVMTINLTPQPYFVCTEKWKWQVLFFNQMLCWPDQGLQRFKFSNYFQRQNKCLGKSFREVKFQESDIDMEKQGRTAAVGKKEDGY